VSVHSTYTVQTGSVALSASATKSLWLIAPATVDFVLTEFGISFDASTASTAIRVDLYRTTTLGSPAGTTGTLVPSNNPDGHAALSTALTALSAEPTTVQIIKSWFVQPTGGLLVMQHPLGREPAATVTNAGRLGLRAVTPAAVSPNCVAYAEWEE
jgi:hypothetical protein